MELNKRQEEALAKMGIKSLNEMQKEAIQAAEKNNASLLLSPTGSGKTLAFLLPLLNRLKANHGDIQALIITPTRELAIQIEQVFKSLTSEFKVNVTYGGHSMKIERNNFSEPPALLIGTPGRLVDHINRGNIDLTFVNTLILDEFDKSLEMGFQEDIEKIIKNLRSVEKRVLVSATDLEIIPAYTGIENPARIDYLVKQEELPSQLKLFKLPTFDTEKMEDLFDLLCSLPSLPSLIFCNHRDTVERVGDFMERNGIQNVIYHGGLEQDERERALIKFRNGSAYYLITTDLAARGLDIPEVEHVIHYQLPNQEAVMTHRNGRTARQGASGSAYFVLTENEYLPEYISQEVPTFKLKKDLTLPHKPLWKSIYLGGGKKDKINKVDVVGFLMKIGGLEAHEIGMITVLDHSILVAIVAHKGNQLMTAVRDQKIKGKKVKIGFAR